MTLSFDDAYKEALAVAPRDLTIIETLSVLHSTFPSPLRFCKSEYNLTINGNIYIGRKFDVTLPEMSSGTNTGITISVTDMNNQALIHISDAVETLEPIKVDYATYTKIDNNDTFSGGASFSSYLEAINISIKDNNLSLSAGYPDLLNNKLPKATYNATEYPGLRG